MCIDRESNPGRPRTAISLAGEHSTTEPSMLMNIWIYIVTIYKISFFVKTFEIPYMDFYIICYDFAREITYTNETK
jgi:hypothetical protein